MASATNGSACPTPGSTETMRAEPGTGDLSLEPEWEQTVERARHRGLYLGRWKLLELPTREGVRVELYSVRSGLEGSPVRPKTSSRPCAMLRVTLTGPATFGGMAV